MRAEAILFDLDGTLVNTLYSLQDTINRVLEKFGYDRISEEDTRLFIGNGSRVFVRKSLEKTAERLYRKAEKLEGRDPDAALELDQKADDVMASLDEVHESYRELFSSNCTYRAEAYPLMKETIAALRAQGRKIACVTNKSLAEAGKVLSAVYPEGSFDYISADDGRHPLKPDAGVVHDACRALGIDVSASIFVGDSRTDVETAKNAGIASIGCVYGFRGRKELEKYGATVLVESAGEIPEAVARLEEQ